MKTSSKWAEVPLADLLWSSESLLYAQLYSLCKWLTACLLVCWMIGLICCTKQALRGALFHTWGGGNSTCAKAYSILINIVVAHQTEFQPKGSQIYTNYVKKWPTSPGKKQFVESSAMCSFSPFILLLMSVTCEKSRHKGCFFLAEYLRGIFACSFLNASSTFLLNIWDALFRIVAHKPLKWRHT